MRWAIVGTLILTYFFSFSRVLSSNEHHFLETVTLLPSMHEVLGSQCWEGNTLPVSVQTMQPKAHASDYFRHLVYTLICLSVCLLCSAVITPDSS